MRSHGKVKGDYNGDGRILRLNNIPLEMKDIIRLRLYKYPIASSALFLNDEIINSAILLHCSKLPSIINGETLIFSNFTFTKLTTPTKKNKEKEEKTDKLGTTYRFDEISPNFTTKAVFDSGKSIFDRKYILFPIHINLHWLVAVINMPKKLIVIYDSLSTCNHAVAICSTLLHWIKDTDEVMKRIVKRFPSIFRRTDNIGKFDISEWGYKIANSFKQENGYDCGIYTLITMILFCSNKSHLIETNNISQNTIDEYRKRLFVDIMSYGKFDNPMDAFNYLIKNEK